MKGDGAALALPRISRVILVFLLVVFVSSSHRRLFFFSLSLSESKSQVTPKDEGVAKEAAAVVVAVVVDSLLSPHLLNNMVDITQATQATQATQRAVHSLSLLLSLSLSLSLSLFSYPRRLLCCSVRCTSRFVCRRLLLIRGFGFGYFHWEIFENGNVHVGKLWKY